MTTTAVHLPVKGDRAVYAPPSGIEYLAMVKTVHRDGSATVEVQWAIKREELTMGYHGDRYRVPFGMLASRTKAGTTVANLKHCQ